LSKKPPQSRIILSDGQNRWKMFGVIEALDGSIYIPLSHFGVIKAKVQRERRLDETIKILFSEPSPVNSSDAAGKLSLHCSGKIHVKSGNKELIFETKGSSLTALSKPTRMLTIMPCALHRLPQYSKKQSARDVEVAIDAKTIVFPFAFDIYLMPLSPDFPHNWINEKNRWAVMQFSSPRMSLLALFYRIPSARTDHWPPRTFVLVETIEDPASKIVSVMSVALEPPTAEGSGVPTGQS